MLLLNRNLRRGGVTLLALGSLAMLGVGRANATMSWTDWTSATVGTPGSALGSLLVGATPVTVTYAGEVVSPTQTAGGTAYWATNSAIYTDIPDGVDSPPVPTTDIISINGGNAIVNTITFSQPIVDPVMAILSLGQVGQATTYNFVSADFTVLNSGAGFFGGGTPSLFRDAPGVLRGVEGHGIIGFTGTYTSISWTVPTAEFWHGFTIGVRGLGTAAAPEPGSFGLAATGLLTVAGVVLRRRKA